MPDLLLFSRVAFALSGTLTAAAEDEMMQMSSSLFGDRSS